MAAVLTVLYFDLRVRKEGFDLQLLARGVGQDASAYATSPRGRRRGERARQRRLRAAAAERRVRAAGAGPRAGAERRLRAAAGPGGPDEPRESHAATVAGGLQSGDPLAGPDPPERREGDGGSAS